MKRLIQKLRSSKDAVAFTGAGVSTLCGIPDFRGPQGLYSYPDAERIFDIDWFERDPSIYYRGCRELVYGMRKHQPGPVHDALFRLETAGSLSGVVTQNIDMLHQKAGSRAGYELHGSGTVHRCFNCGLSKSFDEICTMLETVEVPRCDSCGGPYKPDITFFGEPLPEPAFSEAIRLATSADLMMVLGSSLTVYPAASIPVHAVQSGAALIIVNSQPTPLDRFAILRYSDLSEFAAAILEEF